MGEILLHGVPKTFTAKEVRDLFDIAVKYYCFDYSLIALELNSAFIRSDNACDYHCVHAETGRIDHLPDDFEIGFGIAGFKELYALADKYSFISDALLEVLAFSLNFIPRMQDTSLNNDALEISPNQFNIQGEKRKLYEFLLDNPHGFDDRIPAKARMEIRYGMDSQIEIDNYDNWLYKLLKRVLHDDLTLGGRFEYERQEKTQKPNRAPSFGNFVAYNTYLLLKESVGSKSKFPAEFSNFIIDFCGLCGVELIEGRTETSIMTNFLRHNNRQYHGEPIPFSSVR